MDSESSPDEWIQPSEDMATKRVLLVHDEDQQVGKTGEGTSSQPCTPSLVFVSLPHPRTGMAARYAFRDDVLLEVERVKEGSWFVGEEVVSDGSLYFVTPMDPLFLLVPLLEKSRSQTGHKEGVFTLLSQSLGHPEFPATTRLRNVRNLSLDHICDSKEIGPGELVYRLNDDRVLRWLRFKVDRLAGSLEGLPDMQHLFASSSQAIGGAEIAAHRAKERLQRVAVDLICEYVSDRWKQKLQSHYGIQGGMVGQGSDYATFVNHPRGVGGRSDGKEIKKPSPSLTPGQRKLSKVDTSAMRSISSFFGKK